MYPSPNTTLLRQKRAAPAILNQSTQNSTLQQQIRVLYPPSEMGKESKLNTFLGL